VITHGQGNARNGQAEQGKVSHNVQALRKAQLQRGKKNLRKLRLRQNIQDAEVYLAEFLSKIYILNLL
jgi:hypothetical protein